ncbi:hypothetical protein RQP46_010269 [Phenoliferia psychrophenolica]
MATIDSLPSELLSAIFSHLSLHPDYRDLRATSLVCRRWQDPAQGTLFQTVLLRSERQGRAWLQSPARTRHYTRRPELQSDEHHWEDVMEACPGLQAWIVGVPGGEGHLWGSEDAKLDLNALESLSILHPEHFPTSGALLPPSLRHLELYLDCGGLDHPTPDLPSLTSSSLHHIFSSSVRQSLTSLHLVGLERDSIAHRLLQVLVSNPFPNVLHLILEDIAIPKAWPTLLSPFPALLTLELIEGRDAETGRDKLEALGASVPSTLQNLIITTLRKEETTLVALLRIIKLPNFESLRRLELPTVRKDDLARKAGLALLEECELRTISILCRDGYLTLSMMS